MDYEANWQYETLYGWCDECQCHFADTHTNARYEHRNHVGLAEWAVGE